MYDSILVATDGSDNASDAVDHAVALARQLEVPLSGIAVVETRIAYDNAIVDPEKATQTLRARAEAALEDLEAAATAAGVPVTTDCRTGVPYEEVLAYADEHDIELLVVGATGRSSFKGALLGSTVDAVVRLADRPVLVVGMRAAND